MHRESNRKTATLVSLKDGERTFGDPALNAVSRYTFYKYLLFGELVTFGTEFF